MAAENDQFHWADYLLFAVSLAVTLAIGLYLAIKEKWLKQSKESYLMANRKMNWFLVGLSFINTTMSAGAYVIYPVEYYYFGMELIWAYISYYIGVAFTTLIIIPKFYRLGVLVTSGYQYFEHRFNLAVRMVVGIAYCFMNALDNSVLLYLPSLVLSQVSALNIYWSTVLGAAVCLFYTGLGGMKGVIWVDSLQMLIIAAGMIAITAKGIINAGGLTNVWDIYTRIGERTNWIDTGAEPWDRHNLWSVIFLNSFTTSALYGVNQAQLQRYLTVPSMRKSQISVVMGITVAIPYVFMVILLGLSAFVTLGGNEPTLYGDLSSGNQIVPYFMMYLLGDLHGLPGLIVAAFYAAALSSLSSGQNALVAVFLEDVIQPIYLMKNKKPLDEKKASVVARILGIMAGVAILGLSLVLPNFNAPIKTLASAIRSFMLGPIFGLMMAGFFCFWVEAWGAVTGFICSVAWAVMLFYTSQSFGQRLGRDQPPLFKANFTERINVPNPTVEPTFFDVSYTWYTFLDLMVVLVVSTVVSLIIHCCRHGRLRRSDMMPPKEYRYTKDDFLAAIGCVQADKHEASGTPDTVGIESDVSKQHEAWPTAQFINQASEKTQF